MSEYQTTGKPKNNAEMEDPTYQAMYERLAYLERRNSQLLDDARRYEAEKRYMEGELIRIQKELKKLKIEVERLKVPPLIVGTIRDILTDGRVVVKSSTGPDFVVNAAEAVLRENLTIGARVALNKQTLAVMAILPPSLDPIVLGAEIIQKPETTYNDIGGLDDQLREIREAVELPLLKPDLYKKVGIEPPKGVLLIGPPGTGKTLIAKAIAHHTNATFIRLVGSEFVQKYIGEGARLVRELFDLAKEKAPAIIFVDELDAIGAKRLELATSGDREVQRTLMQFLAELDGFDPISNIKIIGATNRPDILDEALLRPGRFDRIITIQKPNFEARVTIFKIHMRTMNISKPIDCKYLSSLCEGATGADIKAICTEAGMFAIRDNRSEVILEDFENAIEKIVSIPIKQKIAVQSGPMFA